MSYQLNREIDLLKRVFLSLSTRVEENLHLACQAFETLDGSLSKRVIQNDDTINREEMDVEEECLKILALHQPVASELRFIVSILKINNALERIGDLAANIAKKVIRLTQYPDTPKVDFDFSPLTESVGWMIKSSLDSLVNVDAPLARAVCRADDNVDSLKHAANKVIIDTIKSHPDHTEALLNILSIARHLERIADHAVHIAIDVIYMVEGSVIRHNETI